TLTKNFDRIVGYFEEVKDDPLTPSRLNAITSYFLAVTETEEEVAVRTLSKVLKLKDTEAKEMFMSTLEKKFIQGIQEGINKGMLLGKEEGKEEGIHEGTQKGKTQAILKILNKRFKRVPSFIVRSLNSYTDSIALDSLCELAVDCENLTEFKQALAH
ncbi:MAG: hypothetical protein LBE18_02050, partial [Planctomycetaceae bacterium]|nr:hypothetical protein [Planctomycetaceae bacterium]